MQFRTIFIVKWSFALIELVASDALAVARCGLRASNSIWLDRDANRHLNFSTAMLRAAFSEAIIDGSRLLTSIPGLDVTPGQNVVEYRENVG